MNFSGENKLHLLLNMLLLETLDDLFFFSSKNLIISDQFGYPNLDILNGILIFLCAKQT